MHSSNAMLNQPPTLIHSSPVNKNALPVQRTFSIFHPVWSPLDSDYITIHYIALTMVYSNFQQNSNAALLEKTTPSGKLLPNPRKEKQMDDR